MTERDVWQMHKDVTDAKSFLKFLNEFPPRLRVHGKEYAEWSAYGLLETMGDYIEDDIDELPDRPDWAFIAKVITMGFLLD